MVSHKIEIDEETWQFLKKNAEPFEDTPNSVLKRLLIEKNNGSSGDVVKAQPHCEFPIFSYGVPQALVQILEVIYGVRKLGMTRTQATNVVAQKRKLFPQTVIDKYCRQLNKRAHEIDRLLAPQGLIELESLLSQKFVNHKDVIRDFFKSLGE
ncbi:MAG: hypothetical protein WA126_10190 [Thermodesulfovibrionales bacterium]